MITYIRCLINSQTMKVEHCLSEEIPIPDVKILELIDKDGNEVEFIEWNGAIESDKFIRAAELYPQIEKEVLTADREPKFAADFLQGKTQHKMEKYTKQRYQTEINDDTERYVPDSLPDNIKTEARSFLEAKKARRLTLAAVRNRE